MSDKKIVSLSELKATGTFVIDLPELKDEIMVVFDEKEGCPKAFSTFCPHYGGPLSRSHEEFRCYWHGLRFDFNGECKNHNLPVRLSRYACFVEQDEVVIDLTQSY
jgi:nitrite reductase/ring-hydroxylating ferredoxin subunit